MTTIQVLGLTALAILLVLIKIRIDVAMEKTETIRIFPQHIKISINKAKKHLIELCYVDAEDSSWHQIEVDEGACTLFVSARYDEAPYLILHGYSANNKLYSIRSAEFYLPANTKIE